MPDIAFIQNVSISNDSSATTIAVTAAAIGSGNAIVGVISLDATDGETVSQVQDNLGRNYSISDSILDTTNHQKMMTFYGSNVTGGPTTFTVTFSASTDFRYMMLDEFSNVTSIIDPRDGHIGQWQSAPTTTTNALTSGSQITTVANDLVWGAAINVIDATTIAVGTGFTRNGFNNSPGSSYLITERRIEAGSGVSVAANFTAGTNVSHIAAMIILKNADPIVYSLMPATLM